MDVLAEALEISTQALPNMPWSPRKSSTTNEVTNRGQSSICCGSRPGW